MRSRLYLLFSVSTKAKRTRKLRQPFDASKDCGRLCEAMRLLNEDVNIQAILQERLEKSN